MLKSKELQEIFQRFQDQNPAPLIELNYSNPYTLLIAVVLSAQATDISVNKVTKDLFTIADTPQKMISLGEIRLKSFIKSIGLYNAKASNIIALSHLLIEKFQSKVPDTLEGLQSLPGVGRKSANVILNSIFCRPTIAVDTHVLRVSNRIGICNTHNPVTTEVALLAKIPEIYKRYAHNWLVLQGRYVCKARKPNCAQCIINDICKYEKKS